MTADEKPTPYDDASITRHIQGLPGSTEDIPNPFLLAWNEHHVWARQEAMRVLSDTCYDILSAVFGVEAAARQPFEVRFSCDSADSCFLKCRGTWDQLAEVSDAPWPAEFLNVPSGKRLGILVCYRDRGESILTREGLPVPSNLSVLQFEIERARRWESLIAQAPPSLERTSSLPPRFFDLDDRLLGRSTDIVLYGAADLLDGADLATRLSDRTAVGRLNDWSRIQKLVQGRFQVAGGEARLFVDLVPENWQHAWVEPKQTTNTEQPVITASVASPDTLDALATPKTVTLSDLMSIRSAAAELGCDQVILHRAIKAKKISVFELGDGTKTVSLSQCREFYENRRTTPGPVPRDHK